MFPGFAFELNAAETFCIACRAVMGHRRRMDAHPFGEAPLSAKVLLACSACGRRSILLGRDFPDLGPSDSDPRGSGPAPSGLPVLHRAASGPRCKIPGLCRLIVNDAVYLPGTGERGILTGRFRGPDGEVLQLLLDAGEEVEIRLPAEAGKGDALPHPLLLLPEGLLEARIGEPVFHTVRGQQGRVVGMGRAGGFELFVEIEDGSVIRLAGAEGVSTLPDEDLESFLRGELERLVPSPSRNGVTSGLPRLQVENGIAVLTGRGESLSEALRLSQALSAEDLVWGLEDRIEVRPADPAFPGRDRALEKKARHLLLAAADWDLFRISLACRAGRLSLHALTRRPVIPAEIERKLALLPGLVGLDLALRAAPPATPGEREREDRVRAAFGANRWLGPARLSVHCQDAALYLEGLVSTPWQKALALGMAHWLGRGMKVEDRLLLAEGL